MPADLVRVRVNGYEKSVGRAHAKANSLEILDEPARDQRGDVLPTTRKGGRKTKPKATVAEKASGKQGASASTEKAAVIEPAPTDKEQNR